VEPVVGKGNCVYDGHCVGSEHTETSDEARLAYVRSPASRVPYREWSGIGSEHGSEIASLPMRRGTLRRRQTSVSMPS
jgi:hypothetical protein